MTEIAVLRFASVPSVLVDEIRAHSAWCPVCRSVRQEIGRQDTRHCVEVRSMVERCVNFEQAKRHPAGTR